MKSSRQQRSEKVMELQNQIMLERERFLQLKMESQRLARWQKEFEDLVWSWRPDSN